MTGRGTDNPEVSATTSGAALAPAKRHEAPHRGAGPSFTDCSLMTFRSNNELVRIWNASPHLALAFADVEHFIEASSAQSRGDVSRYVENATAWFDLTHQRTQAAVARIRAARMLDTGSAGTPITERIGGRLVVWLYGSLGPRPALADADVICRAIEQNADAEIMVRIASSGGLAEHGDRIATSLSLHPGMSVAIVDKYACSAATTVACACRRIRMRSDAVWMVHEASATTWGTAAEIHAAADALAAEDLKSEQHYSSTRGIATDVVRTAMREARYLSADEAMRIGFVDEIIPALPIDWDAQPWP